MVIWPLLVSVVPLSVSCAPFKIVSRSPASIVSVRTLTLISSVTTELVPVRPPSMETSSSGSFGTMAADQLPDALQTPVVPVHVPGCVPFGMNPLRVSVPPP